MIPDKNGKFNKCNVCGTNFSNIIKKNLSNNNLSLSILGARKAGKTTFLSILFYYIEEILTQKTDINYTYLDDKGFSYILENVNKLRNKEVPNATTLNFDTLLITLFENFFYDNLLKNKFILSFLDPPGEMVEREDYLLKLDVADKVFKSQNLFMVIDSQEFFENDSLSFTGFISRFLKVKEERNNKESQNLYLIFTKADKIFNNLYKYDVIQEYITFSKTLKNSKKIDLKESYERLDDFSKKIKKIISKDKKRNFFNILDNNFKNVECFFVSALGREEEFSIKDEFGVMNPLIHLVGLNYNSTIYGGVENVLDKVIDFIKKVKKK
jgi:hypothetical protein